MCPCAVYVAKQIHRTVLLWVNSFSLLQRSTCWDFSAVKCTNWFWYLWQCLPASPHKGNRPPSLHALSFLHLPLLISTWVLSSQPFHVQPTPLPPKLPLPTCSSPCSTSMVPKLPTCFPLAPTPPRLLWLMSPPNSSRLSPSYPLESDPFRMHYKIRDE